jgi:hypothetical protein
MSGRHVIAIQLATNSVLNYFRNSPTLYLRCGIDSAEINSFGLGAACKAALILLNQHRVNKDLTFNGKGWKFWSAAARGECGDDVFGDK